MASPDTLEPHVFQYVETLISASAPVSRKPTHVQMFVTRWDIRSNGIHRAQFLKAILPGMAR